MRSIGLRRQLVTQIGLLLVGLFVLVPVILLVVLATDGSIRGFPREVRLLPAEPTLDRFVEAWNRPLYGIDFAGLLRNSLFVAGGSALAAVVLGASMAYAFARMRFLGARTGSSLVLLAAFLPPIAIALPMFVLFVGLENLVPALKAIEFRGTTVALAVLYAAFAMPLCMWLMRSAFRGVPYELEEAAALEGAGRFATFRLIILPIAIPSILVAALVAFLLGYTEFALAWLFARSEANMTLAMVLASAQSGFDSANWGLMAAHAVLMTVPVVAVFLVLQRALLTASLAAAAEE